MFAILVANNQLVTLIRPKKYSLHPSGMYGKKVFSFRFSSSFLPETSDTTDHAMVNKGLFYSSSLLIAINQNMHSFTFQWSLRVNWRVVHMKSRFQREFFLLRAPVKKLLFKEISNFKVS